MWAIIIALPVLGVLMGVTALSDRTARRARQEKRRRRKKSRKISLVAKTATKTRIPWWRNPPLHLEEDLAI
jgi:hypothetical protein